MLQRENVLNNFFKENKYEVFQLAGDASSRKYFRIVSEEESYVLMEWEPYNPSNYPFTSVLNHFLKCNIAVPEIIFESPETGHILLEDLGDLTLERKFWESQEPNQSLSYYQRSIDEMIKIHFHATKSEFKSTAHKTIFDTEKLLWELNYGYQHLIQGVCEYKISKEHQLELDKSLYQIASQLAEHSKYISHRDYHSRNIMIKLGKVRVIDFQDARLGPVQYDLVSLLKDSYVQIPDEMMNSLIDYYIENAKSFLSENFSKENFLKIYELQSIQRCFKACGSFASFYQLRSDKRYLKYISSTLKHVIKSLSFYPEHNVLMKVIVDSGALDKKYESL
jgi:aminoglycoside/choline kinase family phosphotransferase